MCGLKSNLSQISHPLGQGFFSEAPTFYALEQKWVYYIHTFYNPKAPVSEVGHDHWCGTISWQVLVNSLVTWLSFGYISGCFTSRGKVDPFNMPPTQRIFSLSIQGANQKRVPFLSKGAETMHLFSLWRYTICSWKASACTDFNISFAVHCLQVHVFFFCSLIPEYLPSQQV